MMYLITGKVKVNDHDSMQEISLCCNWTDVVLKLLIIKNDSGDNSILTGEVLYIYYYFIFHFP